MAKSPYENGTRADLLKRLQQLKLEYSTWQPHHADLAENFDPSRFRYVSTDRNKGYKRNGAIINNTPVVAARTLAAGMMSGVTSPARLWFRLAPVDPELAESPAAKEWLELAEIREFEVFAKSNVYNSLQTGYQDLGVFGTHAAILEEDWHDVVRMYCPPVGRHYLANGARLVPDTFFNEDALTVAQLVEQFGIEKCSPYTQNAWKAGNYHSWVDIAHVIEPNRDVDPKAANYRGKAWRSCWFEMGASGNNAARGDGTDGGFDNRFLLEGGYSEFPVLAPRWNVTGVDVYGSSPAMAALPDARALQQYERRAAQVVDKIVNPPMVASAAARNYRLSLLPGEINYADSPQGGKALYPAIEVNPQALGAVDGKIVRHERRINTAMFADLFLMLANEPDPNNKTAREIAERHEEKLIALGPVLERMNAEYLTPLVNRTLHIMLKRRLLPPPPPELQGQEYKVEFISTLAQAQKLVGVTSNDRAVQFAGTLASMSGRPDVFDKLDLDKLVEDQADRLGVSPKIIVPDAKVQQVRAERAKQQQAAQQGQAMLAAAKGAKDLAAAPMDGDTALTRLAQGLGPNGLAAVGGGV